MRNGPIRSSQRTRQAILTAARASFAANGFERTTMRGVAKEAGCDPAMIVRYFKTKRALFEAAIDLPLEQLSIPKAGHSAALAPLIKTFLEVWDRDLTFVSLLRASATDEDAAITMREFFEQRVRGRLSAWTDGSDQRGSMMGAMLLGIAWARYVVRLDYIADASPAELTAEMLTLLCDQEPAISEISDAAINSKTAKETGSE